MEKATATLEPGCVCEQHEGKGEDGADDWGTAGSMDDMAEIEVFDIDVA